MPRVGPTAPTENDRRWITVGVDGSRHARWALKWAADEAKRRALPLRILHARTAGPKQTPDWHEAGRTALPPAEAIADDAEALAATRHPSVVIMAEVVDGQAPKALTTAARSSALLVVGARGRGGFHELLLGSVSDQCIQHASCSTVVVHRDPEGQHAPASEPRLVVGIDGSLGSTRALEWALDEARLRRGAVLGIHAWQYPPIGAFVMGSKRGFEDSAREIVEAATEFVAKEAPDVPFRAVAHVGDAVSILKGNSRPEDLLVVGAHGHGGFKGSHLGSVAHQLARHAECTVVVAQEPVGEHPAYSSGGTGRGAGRVTLLHHPPYSQGVPPK